jgi:hypothetical protein
MPHPAVRGHLDAIPAIRPVTAILMTDMCSGGRGEVWTIAPRVPTTMAMTAATWLMTRKTSAPGPLTSSGEAPTGRPFLRITERAP